MKKLKQLLAKRKKEAESEALVRRREEEHAKREQVGQRSHV